jgi:hypothetical protein
MPNIKLGKLPAKTDERTFKFKTLLRSELLPTLPDEYDIDHGLNASIPGQMFGNDQWGDCVIAGRANWTLRAEYFEQKKILPITTQEVLDEYWAEEGYVPGKKRCAICRWLFGDIPQPTPPDEGLVMLDSLKTWRKQGWKTSGNVYYIHAFAAIDKHAHEELKYSVFLLSGGYIGFLVPSSAMAQFDAEQTWTVFPGSRIEGGHAVHIVGYNSVGPVCMTWGRKQQMTWEFYDEYVDEAYAIVDNTDVFVENSPVDAEKLEEYLNSL